MKTLDNGVPEKLEELCWCKPSDIEIHSNPRSLSNPGFRPEKMAELRKAIQKDGLTQALEIRLVDNRPRLIAGERRLRCVQALVEQDEDCFSRNTGKWDKASKVYSVVKCTVTECPDDKTAARAAVLENLLHEHLTEYELLLYCETLELSGHTRTEQASIFDKSEAWVSQSHSLRNGHPKILEALNEGILGRTQALKFLNYPHDKVDAILVRAIAFHQMEFDEKENELIVYRDKVYDKLEQHEAELGVVKEIGDTQGVSGLRRQIIETEKEADVVERKIKKHQQNRHRKPKPSIGNVSDAANEELTDGTGNKGHVPIKTVRRWSDHLTQLLDGGGELVNAETHEDYNRREVRILRDLMDLIIGRNGLKSPLDALTVTELEIAAK